MGFGLKTPNTSNDIRGKKLILGSSLEDTQIKVWIFFACFALIIGLQSDIHIVWKGIACILSIVGAVFGGRMINGRTIIHLFRMYLRKKKEGDIFVNHGIEKQYFLKEKNESFKK